MQMKVTLNLSLLNEIYDDISENYEKAMEEVETTTTIVREVTTPDFEGVDTNYYILKTQHPLNEADIRCANKNFRPLTLKREGDVLGLMQFLKTKSIKTIGVPLLAIGDNLYSLGGEFLKQMEMDVTAEGTTKPMPETKQIKTRGDYMQFPNYVSLDDTGKGFDIELGTYANRTAKMTIVCESDKRILQSHEPENFEIFKKKLLKMTNLGSQFMKSIAHLRDLADTPIEIMGTMRYPEYLIYPDKDAMQLRSDIRLMAKAQSWQNGYITNQLVDRVIYFMKKYIKKINGGDGFVELEVANIDKLKSILQNVEFVDKKLLIKPLKKAAEKSKKTVLAKVKGLVHRPDTSIAEIYNVKANILDGQMIVDKYLVRIGTDIIFTTKHYPFPKLDCHYGVDRNYCLPNIDLSIISRGASCGKELDSKEIKDPTTCEQKTNYGCMAHYANCGNRKINVIVSCYYYSKIDVYCKDSKAGEMYARAGQTKVLTKNTMLKYNDRIILAEDYKTNATGEESCVFPVGVTEEDGLDVGQITGYTMGAIFGFCFIFALIGTMRKVYNKPFFCCTCSKKKKLKDQNHMSVSMQSMQSNYTRRGRLEQNSFDNAQNENAEMGTLLNAAAVDNRPKKRESITISLFKRVEALERGVGIGNDNYRNERAIYSRQNPHNPNYDPSEDDIEGASVQIHQENE